MFRLTICTGAAAIICAGLALSALASEANAQSAAKRCDDLRGDAAIAACTDAIRKNPKEANLYNNRGAEWADKGNYDKAITDYDQAIKLNPNFAFAYNNRGNAWTTKGDYDKAITDYGQAIRSNSSYAVAYNGRGNAWHNKNEYDKAIADYNQAIKLNPNYGSAYSNRGNAFSRKGDYNKAITDYDRAIKLAPQFAFAYNNRGNAWRSIGNYEKAIRDYNQAITLDPNYAQPFNGRGNAWTNKGDYTRAIADYDQAIRLNPNFAEPYNGRGNAWDSKGDYDKAIADYNQAIRFNPNYADPYNNRGNAWRSKGNYGNAVTDYDQAIKLNPNYATAYYNRGNAWHSKGDYDKAITDYREAVRIDPTYENAAENLRLTLERQSRQKTRDAVQTAHVRSNGKRVALVIGNGSYGAVDPLENPTRDAALIATTLRNAGFNDVILKLNLSRDEMLQSMREFEGTAANADWAAIYFAGHGIEVDGNNYMIPIDAKLTSDRSISTATVNMEYLLRAVEGAQKLRLVILDACRNNPFVQKVRTASTSRAVGGEGFSAIGVGLGRVEPQPGTLVVYAAKSGGFALDGDGKNSPFVKALVKRIEQKPSIEVRRLFDFVREDVFEATKNEQQPFSYGSLSARDDFYFTK